jgi:UPF0755 protein
MSGIGLDLHPGDEEPPRPRQRTGLVALTSALLLALVVIALVALGGHRLLNFLGPAPDYDGSGSGSVVVNVNPGDVASDIGRTLERAGVVKSAEAFEDAASDDARSRTIQPGSYQLHKEMKATLALALLLDPASRVLTKVVVPEGTRVSRILELINQGADIPLEALRSASRKPAALGLPAYANGQLEGFLFPATYSFEPGTSATAALRAMVTRFKQEANSVGLVDGARALGSSPYDVVTIASLVEKEARLAADFGKVARVAYNRLQPSWGKPFGFDSTLNYALPERQGHLTAEDLRIDSPYNSRIHAGLPPTPINSPGTAALQAALHPTPGPWLYFVTIDQSGRTAFSTTHEQFLKDVQTSRANGVR